MLWFASATKNKVFVKKTNLTYTGEFRISKIGPPTDVTEKPVAKNLCFWAQVEELLEGLDSKKRLEARTLLATITFTFFPENADPLRVERLDVDVCGELLHHLKTTLEGGFINLETGRVPLVVDFQGQDHPDNRACIFNHNFSNIFWKDAQVATVIGGVAKPALINYEKNVPKLEFFEKFWSIKIGVNLTEWTNPFLTTRRCFQAGRIGTERLVNEDRVKIVFLYNGKGDKHMFPIIAQKTLGYSQGLYGQLMKVQSKNNTYSMEMEYCSANAVKAIVAFLDCGDSLFIARGDCTVIMEILRTAIHFEIDLLVEATFGVLCAKPADYFTRDHLVELLKLVMEQSPNPPSELIKKLESAVIGTLTKAEVKTDYMRLVPANEYKNKKKLQNAANSFANNIFSRI